MKRFLMTSIVAAALAASPAHAALIAGWDFSQYYSDGQLSTDGASYSTQLSANYSELDPNGSGAESAAFGTLHYDGANGSTAIDPVSQLIPFAGSLVSNLNAAPPSGFDVDTTFEGGQIFFNYLSLNVITPLSLVFAADLTSAGATGSDWNIGFAGKTLGATANVAVSFSTDGINYGGAQQVVLTTNDTPYNLALAAAAGSKLFVKLDFTTAPNGFDGQSLIDNLGIYGTVAVIPEPGTVVLLMSGLAGLVAVGRRRA